MYNPKWWNEESTSNIVFSKIWAGCSYHPWNDKLWLLLSQLKDPFINGDDVYFENIWFVKSEQNPNGLPNWTEFEVELIIFVGTEIWLTFTRSRFIFTELCQFNCIRVIPWIISFAIIFRVRTKGRWIYYTLKMFNSFRCLYSLFSGSLVCCRLWGSC